MEDGRYVGMKGEIIDSTESGQPLLMGSGGSGQDGKKEQMKTRLTEQERKQIDDHTMMSKHMQPEYGTVSRTDEKEGGECDHGSSHWVTSAGWNE